MMQGFWLLSVMGFVFLWIIESRLRSLERHTARMVEELQYLNQERRDVEYAREREEIYTSLPPLD